MRTCKNCQGWLNRQEELNGLERVGFCVLATLFNSNHEQNIIVSHHGRRSQFGNDTRLITYQDFGCVLFQAKEAQFTPVIAEP